MQLVATRAYQRQHTTGVLRQEPFREISRYCYSNEGRASKKYRPVLSRCPFATRGKRMHIDHSSIG